MATQVTITTSELNLRATILRSRITDLVATRKCGDSEEFRNAMKQFDHAVEQFKRVAF